MATLRLVVMISGGGSNLQAILDAVGFLVLAVVVGRNLTGARRLA